MEGAWSWGAAERLEAALGRQCHGQLGGPGGEGRWGWRGQGAGEGHREREALRPDGLGLSSPSATLQLALDKFPLSTLVSVKWGKRLNLQSCLPLSTIWSFNKKCSFQAPEKYARW